MRFPRFAVSRADIVITVARYQSIETYASSRVVSGFSKELAMCMNEKGTYVRLRDLQGSITARSRAETILSWLALTDINQITGICDNNRDAMSTANDNVSGADCRGLKLRVIHCNADELQDKYNEIRRLRVLVARRSRGTE